MAIILLWFFSLSASALDQTHSLSGIQSLSQETFEVLEVDELNRAPAFIKWQPVKGASYYMVFTTRYEDFKGAREYRTSKPYLHVVGFVNERYYWKVVAYHKNGQRLSEGPATPFTFIIDYGPGKQIEESGDQEKDASVDVEAPYELPDSLIIKPQKFKVSASLGAGILSFEQNNPVMAIAESDGLMFPSVEIILQTKDFWNRFSLELQLQNIMGKFESDAVGITLRDTDLNWFNYGLQFNAFLTSFKMLSVGTRLTAYAGYYKNDTPYIESITASDLVVGTMELSNIGLGLRFEWLPKPTTVYYADMSYSTAMSSKSDTLRGEDVGSAPQVKFQAGALYSLSERFYLGGGFRYDMRTIEETLTTSSGVVAPGTRDVNFMGLELKLGADF